MRPASCRALSFLMAQIVLHPCCAGVPTGSTQASEDAVISGFLIDMEGLRVILRRKSLDLVSSECVRAEYDCLAEAKPVIEGHAATSRLRNIPVCFTCMTISDFWFDIS